LALATLDGRLLRGAIDARTDADRLWVRREEGGVVLASSVAWDEIATATLSGAEIEVDALRERRGELASVGPQNLYAEVRMPLSGEPRRRVRGGGTATVRSVEIVDACVVNLDHDVEPDGLAVTIAAVGDGGYRVAVRGSLTARLIGERRPALEAVVDFSELDRWSQPVAPEDFVDGFATYELRFRRAAPEWQFDLLPDALLEVRLGAFGQGNYATAAPVVIRPFNPWRDNRQLWDGKRFAPREWHGRRPQSLRVDREGLWLHWTR
jgi:hypothetical protein